MTHSRHRWLRRAIWTGLAGLVLLTAWCAYAVRPQRLRAQLLNMLAALPAAVEVGHVRLALPDALVLTDFELIPHRGRTVPPDQEETVRLRVAGARVNCDLPALLRGQMRAREIVLSGVELTIVRSAGLERDSPPPVAEHAPDRHWSLPADLTSRLPSVRIEDADLRLLVAENGVQRLIRRWMIHGSARPDGQRYALRLERLGGGEEPLVALEWDALAGTLVGSAGWMDLETASLLLGERWARTRTTLDLHGRGRLEQIVLAADAGHPDRPLRVRSAVLRGTQMRCSLPFEEADIRPAERFVQLSDTEVSVECVRHGAEPALWAVRGEGLLNGQPASFALTAAAAVQDAWPVGADDLLSVELHAENLALPTPKRHSSFLGSPRVPRALRDFFRNYEPAGRVNVQLEVARTWNGHSACFSLPMADGTSDATGPTADRADADVASDLRVRRLLAAADPRVGRRPAERWQVRGTVEPQGARICYYEFPYEFNDLHGRLRIADGSFYLEEITGRHGAARARVDGVINHAQRWSGFTLTVRAVNLPLNRDLFAALPKEYRELWQQAAPLGTCDVAATVQRAEGSPEIWTLPPTEVRVDGRLLAGAVRIGAGQRLQDASGAFTIAGGVLTLHEMRGRLDGAPLHAAGTLALSRPPADETSAATLRNARTDLRFEIADLPTWRSAPFAAPGGEPAGAICFEGRGDVWGRLYSVGPPTAADAQYTVRITEGVLTGFDPDGHWEQCEGWINVRNDRQDIRYFRARRGDARLEARGSVVSSPTGTPSPSDGRHGGRPLPSQLDVTVSQARLEELTRQFVPPWWHEAVSALGFSGSGEVTLQLRSAPHLREGFGFSGRTGKMPVPPSAPHLREGFGSSTTADTGVGRYLATLHFSAEQMQPALLPLRLHGIQARTAVTADGIRVHEAQARLGSDGQVLLHGVGKWTDGQRTGDFALVARNVEVTDDLLEAMPEAVSQLLKRLAPRGQLDLDLSRVRLVADDQAKTWEFAGQLVLQSGELAVGLPLTELDGTLAGTVAVQPNGQADLTAALAVERGMLAGRPITRWEGTLRRQAGDPWVHLEELRGKLCDGDALGYVRIDSDSAQYELSLTLRDVRLAELLPAKPSVDTAPRRGRLDGHMFLRGTADDAGGRSGGGELRIRGASILQTPVLASVTESKRQDDRSFSDALDMAELRFLWQGSTLRFTRLEILSRDLRLVGKGTWDMHTDALDLTLVGAHPRHWPRVAVLTDLLETAGQELIQYRIRGTVAAPQVSAEPLHRLNETLRALLTGR